MALGARRDPYLAFNFLVEIDGLIVGGFSEVSGLIMETEVEDYREGGLNAYVRRFAGGMKYPANLILKNGITESDQLWQWHHQVRQGIIERRSGSIVLLSSAGEETRRWHFEGAFPARWVGPDLRANSVEVAVESLELVHQGLTAGKRPIGSA